MEAICLQSATVTTLPTPRTTEAPTKTATKYTATKYSARLVQYLHLAVYSTKRQVYLTELPMTL